MTELVAELVTGLCPSVTVSSRKALYSRIGKQHEMMIFGIRDILKEPASVCTTADIWSTNHKSFLGVTVHWLTSNLERRSCAVACRRIKGPRTYGRIADMLAQINQEFLGEYHYKKILTPSQTMHQIS